MTIPIHRCTGCGYAIFEEEPCAVCTNPRLFFGACVHDVTMNKECAACDAAMLRSQVEGSLDPQREFYAVLMMYRESVPYRHAGVLSECFEMLRRRLLKAEEQVVKLETRSWQESAEHKLLTIEGLPSIV
jgi:hypothetical protein